jgi:hypothetical protein
MTSRTPLQDVLAAAGRSARRFDPEEYALVFIRDLVSNAIPQIENNRKSHRGAGEDALTNLLLAHMYAGYPGVSRETDANGHVDIALKHPLRMAIVMKGEAKIIGPKAFNWYTQGLVKLVGQYNSGRDGVALFVCYCRLDNMYERLEEYRERIAHEGIAFFVSHVDLDVVGLEGLNGTFVTEHLSSGNRMKVVHAWVNLHALTDREVAEAEEAARPDPA